jgi:DHA1 family tetracycline resistance protein-like MFS transporter
LSSAAPSRSPLLVLFSVVIVDLIGFGIMIPVLPFYARELGASGTTLGLLFTVFAAAQFLCAPAWGRLSDRIGRRRVMLMTIAGTALALLWLGLAGSLIWLFAARALGGAFAANIGVASAYIADVTSEQDRTRWMGMLGACFGVGFVLGPAIGGVLAPYGYSVPMFAAAGLAAANLLHAAFSLREPTARARREPEAGGRSRALRLPRVRRLCLANFVFSVAVAQLETVFAFFMGDRFGYDAPQVAVVLIAMAVLMGGIQAGAMRRLAARWSERRLATAGSLLLAAGFLALPRAASVAVLLAPLALCAVGRAILQPALMSMASLAAPASERGSVMGTFQASASLARVLGPLAAGWLYDRQLAAPFWLAGALLVAVAVQSRGLPSRDPALAGRPIAEL